MNIPNLVFTILTLLATTGLAITQILEDRPGNPFQLLHHVITFLVSLAETFQVGILCSMIDFGNKNNNEHQSNEENVDKNMPNALVPKLSVPSLVLAVASASLQLICIFVLIPSVVVMTGIGGLIFWAIWLTVILATFLLFTVPSLAVTAATYQRLRNNSSLSQVSQK